MVTGNCNKLLFCQSQEFHTLHSRSKYFCMAVPDTGKKSDIIVVLAGRNGSGKTRLLKNLLGGDLNEDITSASVKTEADVRHTTYNGTTICLINAPTLRNKIDTSSKHLQEFDLLVLCIPISPSSRFQEGNPDLMRSLQDAYGRGIWKHCIIVFTYSNQAWAHTQHQYSHQPASAIATYTGYIESYIESYVNKF